jgi:hypothetical protein
LEFGVGGASQLSLGATLEAFSLYGQWQCLTQSKDALYDAHDHKFRRWCRIVSRIAHKEPRILHWTCNKVNQEKAFTLSLQVSILTLSACLKKISFTVLIHIQPAQ